VTRCADPSQFNDSLVTEKTTPNSQSEARAANNAAMDVSHLSGTLTTRTLVGIAFTASGQASRIVINLLAIVVLSRLLDQEAFGIIAIATIVVGAAQVLAEPGLGAATIQASSINMRQVSSLFYLNVLSGVVVACLSVLAAPLYADAVGEPTVGPVLQLLSFVFLLNGLAAQSDAVLRRRMMFSQIVAVDVFSALAGVVSAIVAALAGMGYWSLALQPLVASAVRVVGLVAISPWKPWPMERPTDVSSYVGFGMKMLAGNLVNAASGSIAPLFIKFAGGVQVLGLWDRAGAIAYMPTRQIAPAVFAVLAPAMARVANQKSRIEHALEVGLRQIAIVSSFLALQFIVSARPIVDVLLGPGWHDASVFLSLLAIMGIVEPISRLMANALVASGQPGALLVWRLFSAALLIPALVVGSNWGAVGVATAYVAVSFAIRAPCFIVFVTLRLGLSFQRIVSGLWFPAVLTVATWAVTIGYQSLNLPVVPVHSALMLALNFVLITFVFLVFVVASPIRRADFGRIVPSVKAALAKRSSP
jgi:PST family polysaccharide transporter